jgi:ATP-dependent Clp protease ATP-binding subunit ClpC
MNYKFEISESAIKFLAKEGYDEAYGARPLGRAIQTYIEDGVADEILNEKVKEGETISVDYVDNKMVFKTLKKTKRNKKRNPIIFMGFFYIISIVE